MNPTLKTIGHVETPYNTIEECPNNIDHDGPLCKLNVDGDYKGGLLGLETGQEILVLYWFENTDRNATQQESNNTGEVTGTFALRSPHRPNPIGAAVVQIQAIDNGCVSVKGLDCLNGTSLLDIKPAIMHELDRSAVNNENQKKYSVQEDRPTEWFEDLYANSNTDGEGVPWAAMEAHPSFRKWLANNNLDGGGKSALVVGCGMGDDAIELESLGFRVTAFDVSATAVDFCKKRFPQSKVDFIQADLLENQPQWRHQFDFVLEIYTVQALPPKFESELIAAISDFVTRDGQILVIAEVGSEERSFENGPPWLLTPEHIDAFVSRGFDVAEACVEGGSSGNEETYVTTFNRTGRV